MRRSRLNTRMPTDCLIRNTMPVSLRLIPIRGLEAFLKITAIITSPPGDDPNLNRKPTSVTYWRGRLSFNNHRIYPPLSPPNVLVSTSCNSVEAVISKHFIRHTRTVARSLGVDKPVYATLALSRDALVNRAEFLEFLEDITALDEPPDGFYLLVTANHADARAEIFHADVIAAWMLLNFTLTVNGFQVINGYSDILTPFLGIAGGHAGASGWWSNLRAFGLEKFSPQALGGRLPVVRYLSCALLNRITYFELDAARAAVPQSCNGLATDTYYPANTEPERNKEVLQTWGRD